MTWNQLTRAEPQLRALEREALAAYQANRTRWADWQEILFQLRRLVGWWALADKPALMTSKVWERAYSHLLTCWETGRRPGRQPGPWPLGELSLPDGHTLERLSRGESIGPERQLLLPLTGP